MSKLITLTEKDARVTVERMSITREQKDVIIARWLAGDRPTRFVVYGVYRRAK